MKRRERSKRRRRALRMMLAVLTIVIGLVAAGMVYLSTAGFPRWLVHEVTTRLSDGSFVLRAKKMRLSPLRGVVVRQAEIYRKGVVGPPALQADKVALSVDWMRLSQGTRCVRGIDVVGGSLRPRLAVSDTPTPGGQGGQLDLALHLTQCDVHGVLVDTLTARVQSDGASLSVTDLRGQVSEGKTRGSVEGQVEYDAASKLLSGQLEVLFDLKRFRPLLMALGATGTLATLDRFDFGGPPPRVSAEFEKVCTKNGRLQLEGRFWFEDCHYRGVDIQRADGRISLAETATNSVLTVRPLFLLRKEGRANGSLVRDRAANTLAFDGASTLDPMALSQMMGVKNRAVTSALRFNGPVRITARGVLGRDAFRGTDFTAEIDGKNWGVNRFVAESCSLKLRWVGRTATISGITGKMYGGDMGGSVTFALPTRSQTNVQVAAELTVQDAELPKVVKALSRAKLDRDKGRVTARVKLEGLMGDRLYETLKGEGHVAVTDGRLFSLPVFGGLTKYVTRIIPPLNMVLQQTDAKADFTVRGSVVHSGNIIVAGDVLSMKARGDYRLQDGAVDYKVQIKLLKEKTLLGKIAQFITWPISKVLEFRLTGTIKDPRWYPRALSRDLLENAGLLKERDKMEPLEE